VAWKSTLEEIGLAFAGYDQNKPKITSMAFKQKSSQRGLRARSGHPVKINAALRFEFAALEPLEIAVVHGRGGWLGRL